jgi:predicted RND superfamily exporter protein
MYTPPRFLTLPSGVSVGKGWGAMVLSGVAVTTITWAVASAGVAVELALMVTENGRLQATKRIAIKIRIIHFFIGEALRENDK